MDNLKAKYIFDTISIFSLQKTLPYSVFTTNQQFIPDNIYNQLKAKFKKG